MKMDDIKKMYDEACETYAREHERANELHRKARAATKTANDAKRIIEMMETLHPSIKTDAMPNVSNTSNASKTANVAHEGNTATNMLNVPPVPKVHTEHRIPDPATDEQLRSILEA